MSLTAAHFRIFVACGVFAEQGWWLPWCTLVHFNRLQPNTAGGSSQGAACSVLAHASFLLQGSEADFSLSW